MCAASVTKLTAQEGSKEVPPLSVVSALEGDKVTGLFLYNKVLVILQPWKLQGQRQEAPTLLRERAPTLGATCFLSFLLPDKLLIYWKLVVYLGIFQLFSHTFSVLVSS